MVTACDCVLGVLRGVWGPCLLLCWVCGLGLLLMCRCFELVVRWVGYCRCLDVCGCRWLVGVCVRCWLGLFISMIGFVLI